MPFAEFENTGMFARKGMNLFNHERYPLSAAERFESATTKLR